LEVNPLPGAEPFPLLTLNQNKRANFKLAPAFLVARRGTAIKLRWELIRGGEPEGESTDLTLTIRSIAEDDPRLPTPNIAGNTSSELNVPELTTDARILAGKWPLFVPGQPIWVTCSGFDKNGDPVNKDVRSGEPNDSADGLSVLAPVEWLKTLKDGSELTIACAVNLDGSANEAEAVSFPQRSYIIKSSISIYENFDSAPKQIFHENIPVTLDSGLIINALKNVLKLWYTEITKDPSPPRLQTMRVTAGSIVNFSWEGPATTIKFEVREAQVPNTITFFDFSGNPIEAKQLPHRPIGDPTPVNFEYKAPAGQYIFRFQINAAPVSGPGSHWFYLDDFTIN
ncbi:hypothetical protein, partial [Pseudomonas fluorescens]|uniref:hypothetical protein n=1 Tax=Pseudomonas fluorescens TaxID=294 RepID=UPI00190F27D6